MIAALAHIDTWIFDLDQTLYPHEANIMSQVEEKMAAYMIRETGLPPLEAARLRDQYLHEHGTTLAGLVAYHNIDPYSFLNEVHDVSLDTLAPDEDLNRLIHDLPGRKLVFTNGDERHAIRLLAHMDMADLFHGVFHLEHANWIPKPALATFEKMMAVHAVHPETAAFFEDSSKNLKPAQALGMKTILVGPTALTNGDSHVDFRSPSLKAFLSALT
ncbi:pyrimidine 5'-nucleotidase [Asticcacaulis benevestitus]|uniref:Pyrimidine 5'-nucleotidase n=1 Tax=Asticcacaulis benevestitus DSM 16100 = ATCC BAA-896 TaxID=1121022 RepID=V4PSR2_9CAUL|nr:pyrimidine 5'-nucleotidase [Asticcacaulis benevestitus]ESQ91376.1 hypothetical protein ABENE_10200 [Asticcacaulis benevestitus DSM 16100 = ATCC BAA-896]